MTIILFLIDTSASMNQRSYLGTSLLDLAKLTVETFLKIRNKDAASRGQDRYMLLSFDEHPDNIKVGWREGQSVFVEQLKRLVATGLTPMGQALGEALKLLNLNRLASGMDNYGLGRYPYCIEQAIIVTITDGCSFTTLDTITQQMSVPRSSQCGSEYTNEPFRWDQRVYSIILKYPGHRPAASCALGPDTLYSDVGPLTDMCAATGGRSYSVRNHDQLGTACELLVGSLQSGVTVMMERIGEAPIEHCNYKSLENGIVEDGELPSSQPEPHQNGVVNNHTNTTKHKLEVPTATFDPLPLPDASEYVQLMTTIIVAKNPTTNRPVQGVWPLPEHFWSDQTAGRLPQRSAHPVIQFQCENKEPLVCPDFPFDKYELAPSALTKAVLAMKQPNTCWQIFVKNSSRYAGLGQPCGYIKAATNLQSVNLFVMPYNYEAVLPLMNDLRNKPQLRQSAAWKAQFENYLKTVPIYYYTGLRKAMVRLNLEKLMPDAEQPFSYAVLSELTKSKHLAKEEMERVCNVVAERLAANGTGAENTHLQRNTPVEIGLLPPAPRACAYACSLTSQPSTSKAMADLFVSDPLAGLRAELNKPDEFGNFKLYVTATNDLEASSSTPRSQNNKSRASSISSSENLYRNAYDIPRAQLLTQLHRMRLNLKQQLNVRAVPLLNGGKPGTRLKMQHADALHELPISEMGNYQEYLQRLSDIGAAPLRSVEAQPVRAHAFGNPFKLDKRQANMFADGLEADIDRDLLVAEGLGASDKGGRGGGKSGRKHHAKSGEDPVQARHRKPPNRRKGPLPRNFSLAAQRKRMRFSQDSMNGIAEHVKEEAQSTVTGLGLRLGLDDDDDRMSLASTSTAAESIGGVSVQSAPAKMGVLNGDVGLKQGDDFDDLDVKPIVKLEQVANVKLENHVGERDDQLEGTNTNMQLTNNKIHSNHHLPTNQTQAKLVLPSAAAATTAISFKSGRADDMKSPVSDMSSPSLLSPVSDRGPAWARDKDPDPVALLTQEQFSKRRHQLIQMVRTPGRCQVSSLTSLVHELNGKDRRKLLLACQAEAKRFKRHSLITDLQSELASGSTRSTQLLNNSTDVDEVSSRLSSSIRHKSKS